MGEVKGRGALRAPYSIAASLQAQGLRELGVHITQEPGQHKDCGEVSERTFFLSGMVEKAPGIWSLKAEACL